MNKTAQAVEHFSFQLSDDNQRLIALYTPNSEKVNYSVEDIKIMIRDHDHGNLFLHDDALAELVKLVKTKSMSHREIVIGERRDSQLTVSLSDDDMSVTMAITPNYGGKSISREDIANELENKNITFGIKHRVIDEHVEKGQASDVIIAAGQTATTGEDCQFVNMLPTSIDRKPTINEDGSVNYNDMGQFVTVKPGMPLLRKIPATLGAAGTDIHGGVIPAKEGQDHNFSPDSSGTELDRDDKYVLIAKIGGLPIPIENGVKVDPNLSVKEVSIKTGNIDFDGTLKVAGDIKVGMKVNVTGDIIVEGIVEGSDLEAGGNIEVKYGIIGRGEVRQESGELGQGIAIIRSGGNIQANFIENAYVKADADITVVELISHCEVHAGNQVVVGQKHSKNGHIIGGEVNATRFIQAKVSGSAAQVSTKLTVGSKFALIEKFNKLRKSLETKLTDREKLQKLEASAKKNPKPDLPEFLKKIGHVLKNINREIVELTEEHNQIESKLEEIRDAKITIGKEIYSGTQICIAGQLYSLSVEKKEPGTFFLENNEITFKR